MSHERYSAVLTAVIQEHEAEIANMEAEIADLKRRLNN